LLLPEPAIASSGDDLRDGIAAYSQGDFVPPGDHLMAAAEAGNAEALIS
jgi:hypothetical protein